MLSLLKVWVILSVNAFVVTARTSVRRSESESYSPNLLLQLLQEIDMGLCNSKPSVAGSPARYATHTPEQAAPSESPPPSRRDSPSSSTSALREALPSPPRRSASLEPQGSPNWQWAGRSGHEGFGGWQEYLGDCHGLVPDGHGALTCASPAAPVDTWSPLAEREQIFLCNRILVTAEGSAPRTGS